MQKKDLIREMTRLGIAPSKKMGQNFLIDDNFLDWIIREAAVTPDDRIVEVGPGFGALTERILQCGAALTAIEFDRKLAAWLREKLVPRGLNLIEGDARRIDFAGIYGAGVDFRVISNLPYSAGTVIVANLLNLELPPSDLVIMLQKEVAYRFAAKPGSDDYGALTVQIQATYETEILRTIPPELFYPRPEIDSCVIRLKRRGDMQSQKHRRILSRLVRTAFAHRRKKMLKQIAAVFGMETIAPAMTVCGIDPDIRAERVSVEQFRKMAELIDSSNIEAIP